MSMMGKTTFSLRDRMRYRFMMQLFGLRLDKRQFERDFGMSVERGLPVEMGFMRACGAFATDNADELTLTPKGRYLVVVMMRQFFIGVNNLRDQARAALTGEERELIFGDGKRLLMTYVSVITLVTYALVLGLLAVVSVIDVRSRRVPNGLAGGSGAFCGWPGVWCSGLLGAHMGLGFRAEFLGPAPDVLVPPGLGNRRHLVCERPPGCRGARWRLACADDGIRACPAQGGFWWRRH